MQIVPMHHYDRSSANGAAYATADAITMRTRYDVHWANRDVENMTDELWMITNEVLKLAISKAREPI